MKFMIHMDNRQADKVCLITYPAGPEHQSSSSPKRADAQEATPSFQSQAEACASCHF